MRKVDSMSEGIAMIPLCCRNRDDHIFAKSKKANTDKSSNTLHHPKRSKIDPRRSEKAVELRSKHNKRPPDALNYMLLQVTGALNVRKSRDSSNRRCCH